MTQVVSLRKGEVVDLDQARARWKLVLKAPGSASANEWGNPQWRRCRGGAPVGPKTDGRGVGEYSQLVQRFAIMDIGA